MPKTLKDILFQYNTDKDKWHSYGDTYQSLLTPHRESATSVLEIGVMNGESLRVWRDFFPNAHVVGIDNNPAAYVSELRISTHIGDQSDQTFLINVGFKYGPFDLIVDDGSHVFDHQLKSLLYLWSFLKPNGIYVIEDIQDDSNLSTFRALGATVHDLRVEDTKNKPYDDILVVLERAVMNYGFKCPEDGCSARAHLSFLTPMNARPKCPRHQTHYVPDINWPDGVKIEDAVIDPPFAQQLLDNCFESSLEGLDEALVSQYADLMASGHWKGVSVEMGGEHYPIYLRDDRVLLGIQRLLACVRSNTPFQTVIVRTYGYY